MIGENVIQSLYQRQGWAASTIKGLPVLDAANRVSRSSKYFNRDYHPLVTLNNIYKHIENPRISTVDFNQYLKELQMKSIRNVLQSIFPSALIFNQTLLKRESNNRDTYDIKDGHFVGVCFKFHEKRNVMLVIKQAGLFLSADDTFNLYLFHSSKNTSLKNWTVTAEEKSETFTDINETIYAHSKDIKGGTYYLGYYAEDITASPIYRDDLRRSNCFIDIDFFQVPAIKGELFNTEDVQTTSQEFLNLELLFYKDYSQLIIQNEDLFDRVIGKQLELEVLRLMYSSTRSNIEDREMESITKQRIFFDINGNSSNENYPYSLGIIAELKNEILRLKDHFKYTPKLQVNTLS